MIWKIEIIAIAIPISTCQKSILKGRGIIIPKLILITKKIPNIPEQRKLINNNIFQIFLCLAMLIILFLERI